MHRIKVQEGSESKEQNPSSSSSSRARTWSSAQRAAEYSFQPASGTDEKDVALVFTDIQNSTKLWEAAPEGMKQALILHNSLLRLLIEKHGGYEVKTIDDAFMVAFTSALDAVAWALECQQALLEAPWPTSLLICGLDDVVKVETNGVTSFCGLRVRIGVHVGTPSPQPHPEKCRMDYIGPDVNLTARISDSAHGGQVVCSSAVLKCICEAQQFKDVLVEALGSFHYKGIRCPVEVVQLTAPAFATRLPFPALRCKVEETDSGQQITAQLNDLQVKRARAHTHTHTQRTTHTHTHTHTHAHTHTHTHTRTAHIHIHTHITYIYIYIYTHARTHARTCTRAHTHNAMHNIRTRTTRTCTYLQFLNE